MAHPRSATLDPLPRIRAAEAAMDLAGRVDRVEPVGQVAPDPVDRAATDLADPAAQAARAITDPAGPGDLGTTDPADLADLVTTDPVVPVDLVTTVLVDLATTDPVDRVAPDSTVREALAVPAAHGTAMTTVATSTTLRGGTDPHPGVMASHRDPDATR